MGHGISFHVTVPVSNCRIGQAGCLIGDPDSGVVNQDVDLAEFCDSFGNGVAPLLLLGNVQRQRQDYIAVLFTQAVGTLIEELGVDVGWHPP